MGTAVIPGSLHCTDLQCEKHQLQLDDDIKWSLLVFIMILYDSSGILQNC